VIAGCYAKRNGSKRTAGTALKAHLGTHKQGQVLWPLCQANLLLIFHYNNVLTIFLTPCSTRALKIICTDVCPSYNQMTVTLECAVITFTLWAKKDY